MPLLGSVNAGIYRTHEPIPWPGQETAQSGQPPRADTPLMRLGLEQQKEQQINAIFQKHGTDYDAAVEEVMGIDPEKGQQLAGLLADGRKKGAEQHKAETESSLKNLEMVGHGIEMAIQDPTQYPKLLDFVSKQPGGSEYLKFAPDPADPELVPKLKALLPAVLGPKDFLKVTADAAQDYIDGDKQLAAAKTLAAAVTPEQRQIADKWLVDGGLKDFSQMWPDAPSAAAARDAMLEQQVKEKPASETDKGQAKEGMYQGRRTFGTYHPSTDTWTVDGKQVSSSEFRPIAPQGASGGGGGGQAGGGGNSKVWDTTGADVLKMVPPQWRNMVKSIGDYNGDPTKLLPARGGERSMVMKWVLQYRPGYQADKFAVRAATRKAFTTGTQGQQINAMNTAIGHIDQLGTLVDKLGNGAFVPGNQVWNSIQTMFGSDKVTNFDTLKDALSGEVASILSKSGATVSGIADAKEKINSANSPTQLIGYVKTQIPIMGSKLAALDYQFQQEMEDPSFSALSPESKALLQKYGFDPKHPTVQGGSGPQEGQEVPLTGPGYPPGAMKKRVNGQWIRTK